MGKDLNDQDDILVPTYFSDVYEVDERVVDNYGAFNVALVAQTAVVGGRQLS